MSRGTASQQECPCGSCECNNHWQKLARLTGTCPRSLPCKLRHSLYVRMHGGKHKSVSCNTHIPHVRMHAHTHTHTHINFRVATSIVCMCSHFTATVTNRLGATSKAYSRFEPHTLTSCRTGSTGLAFCCRKYTTMAMNMRLGYRPLSLSSSMHTCNERSANMQYSTTRVCAHFAFCVYVCMSVHTPFSP